MTSTTRAASATPSTHSPLCLVTGRSHLHRTPLAVNRGTELNRHRLRILTMPVCSSAQFQIDDRYPETRLAVGPFHGDCLQDNGHLGDRELNGLISPCHHGGHKFLAQPFDCLRQAYACGVGLGHALRTPM